MTSLPERPSPPPSRILVERGFLGELHFDSPAHYDAWKSQSWWRRWFWFAPKPPIPTTPGTAPHDH